MSDDFQPPAAPGGGIKLKDYHGELLLFEPKEFRAGVKTDYGESDAIEVTVHVLSGEDAGEVYEDVLLFPKLVVSQLQKAVGGRVLGRVTQGAAKANQSPPWLIGDYSAEDAEGAKRYLAQRDEPKPAAPVTSEPAAEAKEASPVPF